MFKTVRFIIRIVLLFLIALLVLAYFTNPTMDDFKAEAKSRFNEMLKSQTDNPALSSISEMGTSFTDMIIDKMVSRKDYYICSVYTIRLPDGDYSFLGAFRFFYPLQKIDPFEIAKQKLEEFGK